MRRRILPGLLIAAVLGLVTPPAAEASLGGRFCDARGSYRGLFTIPNFGSFTYMSKIDGSWKGGTGDVQFADLEPALVGLLGGTSITSARGAWRRTGPRSVDVTLYQYVSGDTAVMWVIKYSVVHEFFVGCDDGPITARAEVFPFDPDDPFAEGDPFFVIEGSAAYEKIEVGGSE